MKRFDAVSAIVNVPARQVAIDSPGLKFYLCPDDPGPELTVFELDLGDDGVLLLLTQLPEGSEVATVWLKRRWWQTKHSLRVLQNDKWRTVLPIG